MSIRLPTHKASLHISHNEHTVSYHTLAEELEFYPGHYDWISEEEKQKAIEANDCWQIQWYPNTPIGSCSKSAHSLTALLLWLCENTETEKFE